MLCAFCQGYCSDVSDLRSGMRSNVHSAKLRHFPGALFPSFRRATRLKFLGRSGSSRAEMSARGKTAHRGVRHFHLQRRLTREITVWALCQADMIRKKCRLTNSRIMMGKSCNAAPRRSATLASFQEIAVSCQRCCHTLQASRSELQRAQHQRAPFICSGQRNRNGGHSFELCFVAVLITSEVSAPRDQDGKEFLGALECQVAKEQPFRGR